MGNARLDAVDGLRGAAALLILVYHLHLNAGGIPLRIGGVDVLMPLRDGWSGVNLFLVLSGFCLYWPYVRDPARPLVWSRFMFRRVRRIFPGYYASLLLVPAAFAGLAACGIRRDGPNALEAPDGVLDVLLHLVLLQGLWSGSVLSWGSVTWSLSLEWMWYLLFPAAWLAVRRFGVVPVLVAALAVNVAYRVGITELFGSDGRLGTAGTRTRWALRELLPGRIAEFVLGMAVAVAAGSGRVAVGLGRLALPAGLLLLLWAHRLIGMEAMLPWRNLLFSAGYALVLFRVVSASRGWLARVFSHPLLVRIGEWSFSLYLLHMPVVIGVVGLLTWLGLGGMPRLLAGVALCVPLCVGISALAYRAFEAPFLRRKPSGGVPKLRDRPSAVIAP